MGASEMTNRILHTFLLTAFLAMPGIVVVAGNSLSYEAHDSSWFIPEDKESGDSPELAIILPSGLLDPAVELLLASAASSTFLASQPVFSQHPARGPPVS